MKRVLLVVLVVVTCMNISHAKIINLKINPLGFVVGAFNIGANINLGDKFSVGAAFATSSATTASATGFEVNAEFF